MNGGSPPKITYRGARRYVAQPVVMHHSAAAVGGDDGIVTAAPSRAALACGRTKAGTWGGSPKRRFAHFAAEGKVCRAGARNISCRARNIPRSGKEKFRSAERVTFAHGGKRRILRLRARAGRISRFRARVTFLTKEKSPKVRSRAAPLKIPLPFDCSGSKSCSAQP